MAEYYSLVVLPAPARQMGFKREIVQLPGHQDSDFPQPFHRQDLLVCVGDTHCILAVPHMSNIAAVDVDYVSRSILFPNISRSIHCMAYEFTSELAKLC